MQFVKIAQLNPCYALLDGDGKGVSLRFAKDLLLFRSNTTP